MVFHHDLDPDSTPTDEPDSSAKPQRSRAPITESALLRRAVDWLSRREYARAELTQRLKRICPDEAMVLRVVTRVTELHWQSDERYAQSVVRRRAGQRGLRAIRHELQQHDAWTALAPDEIETLRTTEADRAYALLQRKSQSRPSLRSQDNSLRTHGRIENIHDEARDQAVEDEGYPSNDAISANADGEFSALGERGAQALARRQARELAHKQTLKLQRMLASRGFSADAIQQALRRHRQAGELESEDSNGGDPDF